MPCSCGSLRFQDEEIDWTRALDALKRAKVQLDGLDLDQESSQNPAKFFDEVRMYLCAPARPPADWPCITYMVAVLLVR